MSQLPIPGGHTYSDDYTTDRDMNDGGHRIWMMPMIAEFLAHLVSVLATTAGDVSAAAGSATAAAGSATAAAGSATTASNKADAANTSAQSALTSEQHAKTSEDNAKASETAAGNIQTTISGWRTEISDWRTHVSDWRTEISGWRTEISGWRTDVSGWRTEVSDNAATVNSDKGIIAQYKTDTYNYMVAAQTAATNAQTWNPAEYVKKDGSVQFTAPVQVKSTAELVHQSFFVSSAAAARGNYMTARARGTHSAPLPVLNGDTLGGLSVGGYDGTIWTTGGNGGGELSLIATENWSGTNKGARWAFTTVRAGGTAAGLRVFIDENGLILGEGHKLKTTVGNTQIEAPNGSTVVLGGNQTAASPSQVWVAETTHETSRRASLNIGQAWAWIQDTVANGTRDIGLYSSALNAIVMRVTALSGVLTLMRAMLSVPINLGNVSGTVTLDLARGNTFNATLTGVTTFAAPTNLGNFVGMYFTLNLAQDGTGGRTAGWDAVFNFGGTALSLSTGANKIDRVTCYVHSNTQIHVISKKGY